jgi:hypothetical protein
MRDDFTVLVAHHPEPHLPDCTSLVFINPPLEPTRFGAASHKGTCPLGAIARHVPSAPTAPVGQLLRCPLQVRSCHIADIEPRSRPLLEQTLPKPRLGACVRIGPGAPASTLDTRRAYTYHQAPVPFVHSPSSFASYVPLEGVWQGRCEHQG